MTGRTDQAAELQRIVESEQARKAVHSIVAGIAGGDGRSTAVAAAGTIDAAGSSPMRPDTPYFMASITKMYTAVVVMSLAAGGELDLEGRVGAYLPDDLIAGMHVLDGEDRSSVITIDQLLSHTSGLADYYEGKPKGGRSLVDDLKAGRDRRLSIEDVVAIVRTLTPEFAPGARGGHRAHYADTNYALLGAVIEAVTGQRVADAFEQLIFEPLGLTETYVFGHGSPRPEPAALFFGDRVIDVPLAMSSFVADGGLVSTVADSLRFVRGVFGGELLDAAQLASMTRQSNRIFFPLRYGRGVMRFSVSRLMSPLKPVPELIGHSGSTASFAFFCPERDLYLAGTLNQMNSPGRPFRLMTRLLDAA